MQNKKRSLIEAITNTVVGYVINYCANLVLLPLFFGIKVDLATNFYLSLVYVGISIARGFCIRRVFNRGEAPMKELDGRLLDFRTTKRSSAERLTDATCSAERSNHQTIMTTFEQTEKVSTGLDVAIKAADGRVIAWTYNIKMASEICWSLNNVWSKSDGSARCSTCETIKQNDQAES